MANLLSKQAKHDRICSERSLYYLCKEVLNYREMVPHVHGHIAHFATHPSYGRFRQATVPRSWFKTWLWTVGKSIWLTLPDEEELYKDIYPHRGPNIRILIASNVIDNAAKMINKIKQEWMNNERLKSAFPELVPDFNKTRWSDSCAEVRRTIKAQEGTYTAVGVGGSVISQHFYHLQEDDLIYAKKDDFTGQELMPSQEDIENAIGWHKIAFSLLANPKTGTMDNVGTRWAPHDIIDYIRTRESHYATFEINATKNSQWPIFSNDDCVWPERYDKPTLELIRDAQQGPIFETQYLNRPRAGEDITFDIAYLHRHSTLDEYPNTGRWLTIVDLASWKDSKHICRNVVLTGKRTPDNHFWIGRVDAGKFTPSDVIDLIKLHVQQFSSKALIEEVGYQVALRHFARLDMEKEGSFAYTIEQLPSDNRKGAKDLRIQSIEPIVHNGMFHVLDSMKSTIQEMEDYPYAATKDILDCVGHLIRIAPRSSGAAPSRKYTDPMNFGTILDELEAQKPTLNYPFDFQLGKGESLI